MSSLFHPKPLLGVMSFSLYSKPLLDIVIFLHLKPLLDVESLHLKPLLDVESFSSKAIIGCCAFLTLFKAIIGYCDLSSSKVVIRCRAFFHPKPLLGVTSFSLYSKPLSDIVISLHLKLLLDVEFLHLKPLLDVESFFIQSHYWVLCLSHFIQIHYWIL